MSDSNRVVSVIGGTGVFGGRIAEALVREQGCQVRLIGRNAQRGLAVAQRIGAEFVACDLAAHAGLAQALDGSFLVIHAAGPFQNADYRVAEVCLAAGAHYLDLADGREFVTGITRLTTDAERRGLLLASGASSAPAITGALVTDLLPEFSRVDAIHIALSPGNQNPRGPSTIGAVLSYLGKPIRIWEDGRWVLRRGWGDGQILAFPPPIGERRVSLCEVPDLELFPSLFGASSVRFSAGMELSVLNHMLSLCAFAQRFGLDLPRWARLFWRLSRLLLPFGTARGALAVWVRGRDCADQAIARCIALVTESDGPATPTAPAILLARKLLSAGPPRTGALPCVGLLSLDELLAHLRPLGVWCVRGDENGWQPASPMVGSDRG